MTLTRAADGSASLSGRRPRRWCGHRATGFYRHDLDGLRGVAIALVAMFHVWFGRVSGGVDVFLVLSGFFFGGSLLRAALTPSSPRSPMPEIARLVRRLLPALVLVLAASAVLTILIQPQTRWETFADQSLASLGYSRIGSWPIPRRATCAPAKRSVRSNTSGRCRCRASFISLFSPVVLAFTTCSGGRLGKYLRTVARPGLLTTLTSRRLCLRSSRTRTTRRRVLQHLRARLGVACWAP